MIKVANASTSNTTCDKQVRVCDYYDKSWDYILRPPKNVANGIAFTAEKLCSNDLVMYSQEDRLSLNNLLKANNYTLSCINKEVYCDCSSFVGTCVCANGINTDVSTLTTRTMREQLKFDTIRFTDKKYLIKGDILLKEGEHTVIVVSTDENERMSILINGTVKLNDLNSFLNVRKEPMITSKVIGTVNHGEQVKITAKTETWYKIKYNNLIGYCSKQYISI